MGDRLLNLETRIPLGPELQLRRVGLLRREAYHLTPVEPSKPISRLSCPKIYTADLVQFLQSLP